MCQKMGAVVTSNVIGNVTHTAPTCVIIVSLVSFEIDFIYQRCRTDLCFVAGSACQCCLPMFQTQSIIWVVLIYSPMQDWLKSWRWKVSLFRMKAPQEMPWTQGGPHFLSETTSPFHFYIIPPVGVSAIWWSFDRPKCTLPWILLPCRRFVYCNIGCR